MKTKIKSHFFPWYTELSNRIHISFGSNNGTALQNVMLYLLEQMSLEMKKIIKKERIKRAQKLYVVLNEFLVYFHAHQLRLKQEKLVSCEYAFICLLSHAVDLHILLSQGDNSSPHVNYAVRDLFIHLGKGNLYTWDVLLHCSLLKKKYFNIVNPVLQCVIQNVPDKLDDPEHYMKFIVLLHLWKVQSTGRTEKDRVISFGHKVKPPINLPAWLTALSLEGMPAPPISPSAKKLMKYFFNKEFPSTLFKQIRKILCTELSSEKFETVPVSSEQLEEHGNDNHTGSFFIDKGKNPVIGENSTANEDAKEVTEDKYIEKLLSNLPTAPEYYENTVDHKDTFYLMRENQSKSCSKNESSSGSHKKVFSSPLSTQNYIKSVVLSDALNGTTSIGPGLIENKSLETDDLSELSHVLDNKKRGKKKSSNTEALNDASSIGPGLIEQESLETDDLSELPHVLDNKKHSGKKNRKAKKKSSNTDALNDATSIGPGLIEHKSLETDDLSELSHVLDNKKHGKKKSSNTEALNDASSIGPGLIEQESFETDDLSELSHVLDNKKHGGKKNRKAKKKSSNTDALNDATSIGPGLIEHESLETDDLSELSHVLDNKKHGGKKKSSNTEALNDASSIGPGLIELESLETDDLSELPHVLDNKKHSRKKNRKAKKKSSNTDALNDATSIGPGLIEHDSLETDDLSELSHVLDNKKHGGKKKSSNTEALNDASSIGPGLIELEPLETDDLSELYHVLDNKKHGGKKKSSNTEALNDASSIGPGFIEQESETDDLSELSHVLDNKKHGAKEKSSNTEALNDASSIGPGLIEQESLETDDLSELSHVLDNKKHGAKEKSSNTEALNDASSIGPGLIELESLETDDLSELSHVLDNKKHSAKEKSSNTEALNDASSIGPGLIELESLETDDLSELSHVLDNKKHGAKEKSSNTEALNDASSIGPGLIEQESLETDDLSELSHVLGNKKCGEKNRKAKKKSSNTDALNDTRSIGPGLIEQESLETDDLSELLHVLDNKKHGEKNQNDLFDITCSNKPSRNKKKKQVTMTEFKTSPGSISSSEIQKNKKKKRTNLKAKNSFSLDRKSYDNTSNISIVDNKSIEIYGNTYSSPQSKIIFQDEGSTYMKTKKQYLPAVEYDVQILTDDANPLDIFRSPIKQVKRLDAKINSLSLEDNAEQSESHLEPSGSSGGNTSNVPECSPVATSPSIKSRTTIFESICSDEEVAASVESDDEASDLDFTAFLKNSLEIPEIAEDSVAVNSFTIPTITPTSSPCSLVSQLYSFCETLESPEKCSGKNESFDLGEAKMVDALNSGQKVNKLKSKQNFVQNVEQECPCDSDSKNTSLEHKTSICTDDKSLRNTKYTSPQSLDLVFSKQRKQQNMVITDSKKLESLSNQESFSELDVVKSNIYAEFHTPCKISSDHSLRSSEKIHLNRNNSPSEVKYITLSPFHSNNQCVSQSPDKSFINQIDNTIPKKSETQVGALHFTPSKKQGKFPEKGKTSCQLCDNRCQITTDISLEHSPRLQREKETPCKKMCVNDFSENHKSDEDNSQSTCSDIKQSTNSIGANVFERSPKLRKSPKMSPKKLGLVYMTDCNEKLEGKEENSQYELSDMNQSGGGLIQSPRQKKNFELPCAKLLISDFGQSHKCNEGNSQYPSSNVKQCNDSADIIIISEQPPNLIKKVKVSLKKINLSQNDSYEKLKGKSSQCELLYENQDNITTDTVTRQSPRGRKNSGTLHDKLHVNDAISHYDSFQYEKPDERQSTKTVGANSVLEQSPHLRKSPKMSPKKLEELSKAVTCEKHEGKGENLQCKLSDMHQDSITPNIVARLSPKRRKCSESPHRKLGVNGFTKNHKDNEGNSHCINSDGKHTDSVDTETALKQSPDLGKSTQMSPKKLDVKSHTDSFENIKRSQYKLSDNHQDSVTFDTVVRPSFVCLRQRKCSGSPNTKLCVDFSKNHESSKENSQYTSSDTEQYVSSVNTNARLEQSPDHRKSSRMSPKNIGKGDNVHSKLSDLYQDGVAFDTVVRQSPRGRKNSGTLHDKLHVNDAISHYESFQYKKPDEKQSTKTVGANNVLEQSPHLRKSPKMSPKKLKELSKAVACEKHEGKGENLQCNLSDMHQNSITPNIVARLSPKQRKRSESPHRKLGVNGFTKNHKDNEGNSHCINSDGKHTDSVDTETALKQSPDLGKSTQMSPKKLDVMSHIDSLENIESSQYKLPDNHQDSVTFDTIVRQSPRQKKCSGSPHTKLCVEFSKSYESNKENSLYTSSDTEQCVNSVNTNADLEQSPKHRKKPRMSPKNLSRRESMHCKLSDLCQDSVTFDTVVVKQSPGQRKSSESPHSKLHVNDFSKNIKDNKENSQHTSSDMEQCFSNENANTVLEQSPNLRRSPRMLSRNLDKGENSQYKLSNMNQDSVIIDTSVSQSLRQRKISESPCVTLCINDSENDKNNERNFQCMSSDMERYTDIDANVVLKQSPNLRKSSKVSPKKSETESPKCSTKSETLDNTNDSVLEDYSFGASPKLTTKSRTEVSAVQNEYFSKDVVHKENIQKKRKLYPQATRYRAKDSTISDSPLYDIVHIFQSPQNHKTSLNSLDSSVEGTSTIKHLPGIDSSAEKNFNLLPAGKLPSFNVNHEKQLKTPSPSVFPSLIKTYSSKRKKNDMYTSIGQTFKMLRLNSSSELSDHSSHDLTPQDKLSPNMLNSSRKLRSSSSRQSINSFKTASNRFSVKLISPTRSKLQIKPETATKHLSPKDSSDSESFRTVPLSIRKREMLMRSSSKKGYNLRPRSSIATPSKLNF